MAKDKKGFVLYADMKSIFDKLPNDKAGELIKHIFSYVNDENPSSNDLLIDIAFEPIKLQLKRDLSKWESKQKQRSAAGKKSAESRKAKMNDNQQNSTTVDVRSTKSTVKGTVTVTGNVTGNVKVPTVKDIKEYTLEKGYEVDANKIFHYYNDNDWHDAKGNKVKNWKTKILNNWCKEENKIKPKPFNRFEYDIPTADVFGLSDEKLKELCLNGTYPKLRTA